jgi:hypothetical protein
VTQDDLLYRFRLRVFAMAGELSNVRAACRAMGIHPSTDYLRYDNTERAHTGRWTNGRTPDEVLGKAKLWHKQR